MQKYRSKRVIIDWIKFDSKIEWEYYNYLKTRLADWEIISIKCHPKYLLQEWFTDYTGKRNMPITYEADFEIKYSWLSQNIEVIDVKWMATEVAKIKRKLFLYRYPSIEFKWVCYVKMMWGRVSYDDNHKRLMDNKKSKKVKKS